MLSPVRPAASAQHTAAITARRRARGQRTATQGRTSAAAVNPGQISGDSSGPSARQ
ncbi:hypothetical protein [Amycolatopsis methanolica]|uniref:hypothetical protein n=1 Tax=Amycolatopsis methanolica TaxID=1814 RepID=UPI00037DBF31|nr:hypothetical protein [Amycolatopsis methanolica]